jgi:predicted nucleic acid-binding protein
LRLTLNSILKTVEDAVPPFPPPNELCLLDANTFYYDVIAQGDLSIYCSALIREIVAGQRHAATTSIAAGEAIHKVMFSEASTVLNRPRAGLLSWAKSHPAALRSLSVYRAAAEKIASMPIEIVTIDAGLIRAGAEITSQTGLLINDAIMVAVMKSRAIRHLVTNDDDFDNVAGIKVWKPR